MASTGPRKVSFGNDILPGTATPQADEDGASVATSENPPPAASTTETTPEEASNDSMRTRTTSFGPHAAIARHASTVGAAKSSRPRNGDAEEEVVMTDDLRRRIDALETDETSVRSAIQSQSVSSWNSFLSFAVVPALLTMNRSLMRESHAARRELEETGSAVAERDAQLSGILMHEQSRVKEIESLKMQVDKLQNELRSVSDSTSTTGRARDVAEGRVRDMELQLLEARELVSKHEARSQHHKEEADAASARLSGVQTELRDASSRLLQKENDLLAANSMLTEVRTRLRNAEANTKQLRERNDALIREFQRVADDVAGQRAASSSPSGRSPSGASTAGSSEDSEGTLNAVQIVSERLGAAVSAKEAEISELRQRQEQEANARAAVEANLRASNDAAVEHRRTIDELRDRISSLESIVKRKDDEAAFTQTERDNLREELVEAQRRNRGLEQASNDLTLANSNLQREASLWERRIKDIEGHGNNTAGELEKARQELEAKQALVAHLETAVDRLETESSAKDKRLKLYAEALEEAHDVIEPLRAELNRYERVAAALKQKFSLNAERHSVSGRSTPRTGHYRRDAADPSAAPRDGGDRASVNESFETTEDSAAAEVEAFVRSRDGSIVERLQDVIFAKDEEIRVLQATKARLSQSLQDAEVTIDRLTRDALAKQDEFRLSLQEALSTFTRVGGYDKLVEQVFQAKQLQYDVHALAQLLKTEQANTQKYQIRTRVLERHLEEVARGARPEAASGAASAPAPSTSTATTTVASPSPGRSSFAERLDAASGSPAARRSAVLTTDEDLRSPQLDESASSSRNVSAVRQREAGIRVETQVSPVATTPRGLLFRPTTSRSDGAAARDAASVVGASGAGAGSGESDVDRSSRFVELEAKVARVERMRQQLLDLETMAITTSSPTKRHVMFNTMKTIHEVAGSAPGHRVHGADDGGRSSTPRRAHDVAARGGYPTVAATGTSPASTLHHGGQRLSSSSSAVRSLSAGTSRHGASAMAGDGVLVNTRSSLQQLKPLGRVVTRWR